MALGQKVDGLTKRFEALFAQADELTKKQLALETLNERLGQVDDLAKKTSWQHGRAPAEPAGPRRCCGRKSRSSTGRTPRSRSCATSSAPTARRSRPFGERMTAFSARAPELEAKMDAILGKMKLVEEGTQKATRLNESVAELDAQMSRVMRTRAVRREAGNPARRPQCAQRAKSIASSTEQLARRTELETLKAALDGVGEQTIDAQHKLEGFTRCRPGWCRSSPSSTRSRRRSARLRSASAA